MKYLFLFIFSSSIFAQSETWRLEKSSITYFGKHMLHRFEGTSHEAKGKGECNENQCEFLLAVAVKSFDSGNSNRDLHMQEVTKAGLHPLVSFHAKGNISGSGNWSVEVNFAGKMKNYTFPIKKETVTSNEIKTNGKFSISLSDFQIERPALFLVSIDNSVEIDFSASWKK